MSAIDNALAAPAGQTAGVLARNMVAATAWRLGCRGVSPLEWHPAHLEEQLNEDFLVEAWHLQRLRTNLRGIRTGAPVGDGLEDIKWRLDLKQEVRRGPRILWEHAVHVKWLAQARPCRYARQLAEVRSRYSMVGRRNALKRGAVDDMGGSKAHVPGAIVCDRPKRV